MEEKQRFTIYMEPKRWKEFKHKCLELDLSASRAVDEAIILWLKQKEPTNEV